jgi:hypothetical protein
MARFARMRIKQVRASNHVHFFEAGFASRWMLNPRLFNYDWKEPCVYLGCYDESDAVMIRGNTSARKVVILTGEGSRPGLIKDVPGVVFVNNEASAKLFGIPTDADRVPFTIPMKDFSAFVPEAMGTKVYVYVGNGDRSKFLRDTLDRVMDAVGRDRFILGQGLLLSIPELIEQCYRPACVNLQINPAAGFTSSVEMALMGRPTIGNFETEWNRPFTDEADLIKQLTHYLEALPGQFAGRCVPYGFFHESDDWLHTEFYDR